MTDKQKEAIERLKYINMAYDCNNYYSRYDLDCIETALNLIQTQQVEIDSLKDFKEIAESKVTDLNPIGLARTNQLLSRQCHKLQEESEKKEKIIDEMATYIATLDIEEDICEKTKNEHCDKMNFGECEDCIKQYFERKVENGR